MWKTPASLQVGHFKRHQDTQKHKRAAAKSKDITLALYAPPERDFLTVLQKFRQGKANGDRGCEDVARRKKVRKMKWCLAEAVRERMRDSVRQARSMTVMSDCSKGHLVLRALMCRDDLEVQDGLLGIANMIERGEASSLDLASAVVCILQNLATPCKSPPGHQGCTTMDSGLVVHMCNIIEVFTADAAADEQLMAELLQKGASCKGGRAPAGGRAPDLESVFPNLLVINKDKAHGARRILSRTWVCDTYLDNIAHGMIMGSHSVVQQIRHSDVWRSRHAKHLRELQHTPVWKKALVGVVGAKHRFDSWQKPFARVCLSFDAVIATAQTLHDERRSEAAGRYAKTFLTLLDEEAMVSLGMMADAGEETIELIRFMDEEQADKCELCIQWRRFLDRVTALFEGKGCLLTGFTAHMLSLLKNEKVVYIDRVPKRIGGRAPEFLSPIVDRCVVRLQSWLILAREVVAAEFPEFETMQAFSVLRFQTSFEKRQWADAEHERRAISDKLLKLARILKLDVNKLRQHFFDHLPVAQCEFDTRTPACTSFAAWKFAITKAKHSHVATRKLHPVDELLKVCVRAGAWGMSTSGVERTFSMARASLTSQRAALDESHKQDDCFILSTAGNNEAVDNELALTAAKIWMRTYAPARASPKTRIRGRPRLVQTKKDDKSMTMKAWTLRRRQEVDKLVAEPQAAKREYGVEPDGGPPNGWTDKHEKEKKFQQDKRTKRALDAMDQGVLLPEEQIRLFGSEEEATVAVGAYRQLRKTNRGDYVRDRLAKRARQTRCTITRDDVCRGKKIWVKSDALDPQTMSSCLRSVRAIRVPEREAADVYVVDDLTDPGQRVLWNAMFNGLSIISPSFFRGEGGPMVCYKAAMSSRKKVWVSNGFIEQHTQLANILARRMAAASSTWKMIKDEEFADFVTRRPEDVLAFVTATEAETLPLPRKSCVTSVSAVAKFAVVDRDKSTMGIAVTGK